MFVEDTEPFLADFGVPATFRAAVSAWTFDGTGPTFDQGAAATLDGVVSTLSYTAFVIFDEPDEDVLGGRAQSAGYEILFRTADLPGFEFGVSVTVNGGTYVVREPPKKLDDGTFSRARLEV